MREDTFTNTEADAAAYEALRGRDEDIGGGVDAFVVTRTPFCSVCQRGTKSYVCGPCQREAAKTANP